MSYQKYIEVARDEVINKRFGTTQQYLWVHEVIFEDGVPKIERVDEDFGENIVAVYFPLKEVDFFLEIHVRKTPIIEVDFVWTENAYRIYLTATSETLTYDELANGLLLKSLEGWSKGDIAKNWHKYTFSRVSFEPIKNCAYYFDKKLDILLDDLEKDFDNVLYLTKKAHTYISVCRYQYVSWNAWTNLSAKTIKRLANLNLSIDIDTYIQGIPFLDN